MEKINYKSDFAFNFSVNLDGKVVNLKNYDWRLQMSTGAGAEYVASRVGGTDTNCVSGTKTSIYANSHGIGPGELVLEFTLHVPDTKFQDGERTIVTKLDTDILLTAGAPNVLQLSDYTINLPQADSSSGSGSATPAPDTTTTESEISVALNAAEKSLSVNKLYNGGVEMKRGMVPYGIRAGNFYYVEDLSRICVKMCTRTPGAMTLETIRFDKWKFKLKVSNIYFIATKIHDISELYDVFENDRYITFRLVDKDYFDLFDIYEIPAIVVELDSGMSGPGVVYVDYGGVGSIGDEHTTTFHHLGYIVRARRMFSSDHFPQLAPPTIDEIQPIINHRTTNNDRNILVQRKIANSEHIVDKTDGKTDPVNSPNLIDKLRKRKWRKCGTLPSCGVARFIRINKKRRYKSSPVYVTYARNGYCYKVL